jgi:hypothetical protein
VITSKQVQAKCTITHFTGKVTDKSENSAYRTLISSQSMKNPPINFLEELMTKPLEIFKCQLNSQEAFTQYPPSCGRLLTLFFCQMLWSVSELRQKKIPPSHVNFVLWAREVSKLFVGQKEEFDVCLV